MNNYRNHYSQLNDKLNVTGNRINYYRNEKGISAQELSNKLLLLGLDIHRQAIFSIESRKEICYRL